MMQRLTIGVLMAVGLPSTVFADSPDYPSAKVSYSDFKTLVETVEEHRAERLVGLDEFLEMSKDPNTVVLDTRSAERFERIHIAGAKHLNFSDFNQRSLAELIPDPKTRILIYCNNNFEGNPVDFTTKVFIPPTASDEVLDEERPVMMALNVPTYINLYGYGYQNVYELDELVNVSDQRIEFAGTVINRPSVMELPVLELEDTKGKR
jgi:hypothetical protein